MATKNPKHRPETVCRTPPAANRLAPPADPPHPHLQGRTIFWIEEPTACDGVVQHDGDMQQNSCRVEPNGFSVELNGRGLKSCA